MIFSKPVTAAPIPYMIKIIPGTKSLSGWAIKAVPIKITTAAPRNSTIPVANEYFAIFSYIRLSSFNKGGTLSFISFCSTEYLADRSFCNCISVFSSSVGYSSGYNSVLLLISVLSAVSFIISSVSSGSMNLQPHLLQKTASSLIFDPHFLQYFIVTLL